MTENEQPDDIDNIFAAAAEEPADGAEQFKMEVDVGDVDLYDHTAEMDAIAAEEKGDDNVFIPDPPEHLAAPINNPPILEDPAGAIREAAERSFTGKYYFGTVTVTPDEREAFLRAALHDTEIVFDVHMEGADAIVRVAIPPESFTTAAAAAVTAWGRSGFLDKDSDMQWLLAFQQVHAWFQVRAINNIPTSWSDTFCDGLPKSSLLRSTIADPENFETFFSMQPVRWRMLVEAMRVAEFKYKLCLEAWHDRSFFTPAGTA